jgi:hypothetical protein
MVMTSYLPENGDRRSLKKRNLAHSSHGGSPNKVKVHLSNVTTSNVTQNISFFLFSFAPRSLHYLEC